MDDEEKAIIRHEFEICVNMASEELEAWLKTERSRSVLEVGLGDFSGSGPGVRIAKLLRKPDNKLTDDDYDLMTRAVGFIKRLQCFEPTGYINESRWRFSLMNWGHDPLRN